MMILDPRFWLALILAIGLGYLGGCSQEHRTSAAQIEKINAEHKAAIEQANADAATTLADETAKVSAAERAAATHLIALNAQYLKEQQDAKTRIDQLTRSVRDGSVRLSIATRAGAGCGNAQGADTAVAGGPGAEARAELDPAAAADLIAIAHDGDAAILQLNNVIDAYGVAVKACAGAPS